MTSPYCQHPAVASSLMTSSDTHPGTFRLASLRFGLAACLMLLSACTAEVADAPIDESELGSVQQAMIPYSGTGALQSRYWRANVRCLDVPHGNFYQGARVQQWGCNYTSAQEFAAYQELTEDRSWYTGIVTFLHWTGSVNLCLDVAGASKNNGAPVQMWKCNYTDAQRFKMINKGNDYFMLQNVNSGKCLDLDGAWDNSPYGSKLQQWDCHGGYNQQFYFDRWYN